MSIFRCENLHKTYGRKPVLYGLDLEVMEEGCCALLGQNGAGKTTLLKCALGVNDIDGGRITVCGMSPSPESRQWIGFASEIPNFPRHFTGKRLFEFLSGFYDRWDMEYAYSVASQFNIPLDRVLRQLSKGMRSQVGLIGAVARCPKLLLLDEPFGGLDPITRARWRNEIRLACTQRRMACLFSTHLVEDVYDLPGHVAILAGGRIRAKVESQCLNQLFRLASAGLPPEDEGEITSRDRIVWRGNSVTIITTPEGADVDRNYSSQTERLDLLEMYRMVVEAEATHES